MGRVSADESKNDPRSQKRRFRTPALFGKVTENRAGNVQQTQETQNNPEHRREVPLIHTAGEPRTLKRCSLNEIKDLKLL